MACIAIWPVLLLLHVLPAALSLCGLPGVVVQPPCRYNPQDINRASLLLGSGAILGRRFQPYEAHIPFLLQLKVTARPCSRV
jgi:hypothetical protein